MCLTDTPGYNYSSNANTTATLIAPVNLKNANWPHFWFWVRGASEQFHDYLRVETSIDGTNWTEQTSFTGTYLVDWKQFDIGMKGYAGKPAVYVRFHFDSNASINNDGWYVDDFAWDDGNPSVAISSPAPGDAWAGGSDHSITWTYDDSYKPLANYLNVSYSDDGFVYYVLGAKLPLTTTDFPWTAPNLNVAKAYVRVEVFDQNDILLSQTTTEPFAIDSLNPGPFALASPADAACGSPTPSFDWTDSTDASGVKYTLTVTPTGGAPFTKNALATSQYTLSAGEALASAGNPYSWTVTATDPAGHTRTSTKRAYSTDSVGPDAFALSTPADQSTSDGVDLTFAWNAATDVGCGGLSKYVLYIDDKVCADNIDAGDTAIALADTKCAALGFGAHTWTIAAVDAFGNVGWSDASPGGVGGHEFSLINDMPGGGGAAGAGSDGGAGGAGMGEAGAPSSGGTMSGSGGTGGTGGTNETGGSAGTGGGAGTSANAGTSGSASMPVDMMPGGGEPAMSNGGAPEEPATGGTGATSAGGRSGGSKGGTKGTTPSSEGGDATDDPMGPAASAGEDAGCGCRAAGGSSPGAWTSLAALLGLLGLRKRRRASRR